MKLLNLLFDSIAEALVKKPILGTGRHKEAYDIISKSGYVVKKWSPEADDTVRKEVETTKKHPDLVANIIKYDPVRRIIIQEKLDTDKLKKEMSLLLFTFDFEKGGNIKMTQDGISVKKKFPKDKMASIAHHNMYIDYVSKHHPEWGYSFGAQSPINKETFKDADPSAISLYNKWIDFFKKSASSLGEVDTHLDNLGYDSKGNIKYLDL